LIGAFLLSSILCLILIVFSYIVVGSFLAFSSSFFFEAMELILFSFYCILTSNFSYLSFSISILRNLTKLWSFYNYANDVVVEFFRFYIFLLVVSYEVPPRISLNEVDVSMFSLLLNTGLLSAFYRKQFIVLLYMTCWFLLYLLSLEMLDFLLSIRY
jgi:hypothetical protein